MSQESTCWASFGGWCCRGWILQVLLETGDGRGNSASKLLSGESQCGRNRLKWGGGSGIPEKNPFNLYNCKTNSAKLCILFVTVVHVLQIEFIPHKFTA